MKACRACYHIIGILVVLVWGATFVNSKVLLTHGMEAHEIFTLRFLIAYLCIWTISPRRLFADNWRDELFMLILGLTGGSLYFLTENWAVKISYVNNVAFIVSFACFALWNLVIKKIGAMTSSNYIYLNPVSTVIISAIFLDEPMTWLAGVGSALILFGVWVANR